jgi:O-succinylbenzoic acid--CoA ligase
MVEMFPHILQQLCSLPQDWLICEMPSGTLRKHNHHFLELTEKFYSQLTAFAPRSTPPKIILAEREPVRFLAGFLAACATNSSVFLCNPNWVDWEWQQVFELVQPDIIWGMEKQQFQNAKKLENFHPFPCFSAIMIPTGGSSGKIKFVVHSWETLTASVRGFQEYFQLQQVNSFCVLPLYHVSGLMQFLRCFITGGQLVIYPWKKLESGDVINIQTSNFFLSLVPTQLQRLLANFDVTSWLAGFQTVLLGGAPAAKELLEKARHHRIPLAITYGMTETASQIATLKPDDFLNGKDNCGRILPHAYITIGNEQGEVLPANECGNITIAAKSLAFGYYPFQTAGGKAEAGNFYFNFSSLGEAARSASTVRLFHTDDIGFLDEEGYLHVVGRSSDKIITGGENIYPLEIESAIRATATVIDVCVLGIPDKRWGQAIAAIYIPKNADIFPLEIQSLLQDKLSKIKIPKYWIPVQTLPRNSQGKINRLQLQQLAQEYLQQY